MRAWLLLHQLRQQADHTGLWQLQQAVQQAQQVQLALVLQQQLLVLAC